jgi:hypothetical protein
VGLTWADVDLVGRRVLIRSPKTAYRGGKHAMRSCPIFPELMPFLEALASIVNPGIDVPMSHPVFPIAGNPKANLRTSLARMIAQAGLPVWDKLFVNLRSSRQTELLEVYPVADVCAWMGNSPIIAAQFYAQSRSEVAERAASEPILVAPTAGPIAGPIGVKTGPKSGPIKSQPRGGLDPSEAKKTQGKYGVLMACEGSGMGVDKLNQWAIQDSNSSCFSKETEGNRPSGAQNGAYADPAWSELVELWPALDEQARLELIAMARAHALGADR